MMINISKIDLWFLGTLVIIGLLAGWSINNSEKKQSSAFVLPVLTSTVSPTKVITLTPTPAIINRVKGTSTTINKLIDCIGPDGKHFQTTEIECKNFNNAWTKKSVNSQSLTNNNQTNVSNYPACTIFYPALKVSQTYYGISPEECTKWKNNIAAPPLNTSTSLITCVVSYPCNGNSYTYQTDQSTCNFMQSSAASTCSTYDAIKKMQDISNVTYTYPQVSPIDGTIHINPTATIGVPYGYGYSR